MNPATTTGTQVEVSYKFRDHTTVKIKGTAKEVIQALNEFHAEFNNQKQK